MEIMEVHGIKRRIKNSVANQERGCLTDGLQCISTDALTMSSSFLLELPVHIIFDILSRLPLKDIIRCRCVCKMVLKLLKDPYFAKVHLARARSSTTNLVLPRTEGMWGALHFFTFDLHESTLFSCRSEDQNVHPFNLTLSDLDAEFSLHTKRFVLVRSCNGLLCLYFIEPAKPFYCICNPVLREYVRLPALPANVVPRGDLSGFGYCPRTKKYKVVSFMLGPYSKSVNAGKIFVHTLGSNSWKKIVDAPWPDRESFDPFLNGCLHWITDSSEPSELIRSFDLEKKKFALVPPPAHFNKQYRSKVSGINIGVLRDCLCICYIYENDDFEVWVMRSYGAKESWTKEFSIKISFYCKLEAKDFHRPIKFVGNGDLWFCSLSGSLVSFSPRKGTFRELRSMGPWTYFVSAHDLSFISLRDVVGAKGGKVKNFLNLMKEG